MTAANGSTGIGSMINTRNGERGIEDGSTIDRPPPEQPERDGPLWSSVIGPSGIPDVARVGNTQAVLNWLDVSCYHSEMTHGPVVSCRGEKVSEDVLIANIRECYQEYARRHPSREVISGHLTLLAQEEGKHEFNEWVKTLQTDPADDFEAVEELFKAITFEEGTNVAVCADQFETWIKQVGAAMVRPKGTYRGVIVLAGPQSIGKSRFVASLAPSRFCLTGQRLDPSDKDSIQQFTSVVIAELSELDASFRRASIEAVKAFTGRDSDTYRVPYGRSSATHGRRSVFMATINPKSDRQFLADSTGNSRWWVFPVTNVNADHGVDMRRVWRWARNQILTGATHWLSAESMKEQAIQAEEYRLTSPIEDLINNHIVADENGRMVIKDLSVYIQQELSLTAWTQQDSRSVTSALRRAGIKEGKSNTFRFWKGRLLTDPD